LFQLPTVTEDIIKQYLDLHDQDLQRKISDLYHAKFIRSIRSSYANDKTYISSRVSVTVGL